MSWIEHGVLWVKLLRGLQIAMVLGSIILVHELGHFLAARWSRMTVDEFSVGIGPTLHRWRRSGTTYRICLFLFMGYVRIRGMDGEPADDGTPNGFYTRPFHQRITVLVAGALMNLVLAVTVFCALYGTWGVPQRPDATVAKVEPSSAAAAAGIETGERIAAVDGQPTPESEQVKRLVMHSQGRSLRLTLTRGGSSREVNVAPHLDQGSGHYLIGVRFADNGGYTPVVDRVDPGKPAYLAGLRSGDRIVSVAGQPVGDGPDAIAAMCRVPAEQERKQPSEVRLAPVPVTVERQGRTLELQVTPQPRRDVRPKESAKGTEPEVETVVVGDVGLALRRNFERLAPSDAVREGLRRSWEILAGVAGNLYTLLHGRQLDQVGGPVMIVKFLSEAAFVGAYDLLNWAGVISIMIGALNLLPLPGLDGGRVLLQVVAPLARYLFGRAGVADPVELTRRVEAYVHAFGLMVLLALMLLISVRDVGRW